MKEDVIFSADGRHAEIGERKWVVGLIMLVAFSPGLVANAAEIRIPGWLLQMLIIPIYAIAFWFIGHYRRAVFDAGTSRFMFREGFVLPYRKVAGNIGEIERIWLHTRKSTPTLTFQHGGREFRMAAGGAAATKSTATMLATLTGRPLEMN